MIVALSSHTALAAQVGVTTVARTRNNSRHLMIVPPPNEYNYPVYEAPPAPKPVGRADGYARLRWWLSWPNWKCHLCNAVMVGHVKYCIYCKNWRNTDTPRPSSYVEKPYVESEWITVDESQSSPKGHHQK